MLTELLDLKTNTIYTPYTLHPELWRPRWIRLVLVHSMDPGLAFNLGSLEAGSTSWFTVMLLELLMSMFCM